jgi:phytanoyl-CoA hydroxylase
MLNAHERDCWERYGFMRLGRVPSDEELEALRQRIDDLMLGRVSTEEIWFQLDSESGDYGALKFGDGSWAGATLSYRKIEALEKDPLFRAYIRDPRFRGITRELIGPEVSIYRAMFMNKPAQRGTHLPYHQDAGSQWQLDRDPFVTIWTALDDATVENGCMQVIPGSHNLGLLSERGHTITPEQEAEFAPEKKSVYLEAKAGEAILLHNLLLHRSGINTTDQPRRAFSVCYMDTATRDISGRGRVYPVVFTAEGAEAAEAS